MQQTHRKLRILQHKRLQLRQKARPLLRRKHRVEQTLSLRSDPVSPSFDRSQYARRSALDFVLSAFGDAVDFFRHTAAVLRAGRLCLWSLSCSCWRWTGRLVAALADLEFPRGVVFLGGSYGEGPRGQVLSFLLLLWTVSGDSLGIPVGST
jgi:hypothetical protein